jgi:hypothetical protein
MSKILYIIRDTTQASMLLINSESERQLKRHDMIRHAGLLTFF